MKSLTLVLVATLLTSFSAQAGSNNDRRALTLGSVETTDVTDQYPQYSVTGRDLYESELLGQLNGISAKLTVAETIVDQVINIGTKVWNVVEKARPVSNYNSSRATALPQGASAWSQLEGWQEPVTRVYQASYKNLMGVEVVRLVYRVTLLYGGSVEGVGRYIGYASVEPVDVNVLPMWSLDATASVDSVYNMGTSRSPVAGMILNVSWQVRSVLSDRRQSDTLTLDARGNIRQTTRR